MPFSGRTEEVLCCGIDGTRGHETLDGVKVENIVQVVTSVFRGKENVRRILVDI